MRSLAFVPLIVLLGLTSARAQGLDPGRISIGAGAGISDPSNADFEFTAPAWGVDLRVNLWRFLAAEVFVEQWRRNTEDVQTDIVTPSGRIDRITRSRTDQMRVIGGSLLARSNGRVAVNGGGGVSTLRYSRESTTTFEGCTNPQVCGSSSNEFDNDAFTGHIQGGVDVRIVQRFAVMGSVRFVLPFEDPGGGHISYLAGGRIIF